MKNPSWSWASIGELFDIGAGKTMSATAREGSVKTPFLRTSNVYWDLIDLSKLDEMSIDPKELPGKTLRKGDLLVCEGGDIGRAAIWTGQVEVVSFQNHLHRLRPKTADIEPRFYVYFLQSAFTQLGLFEGAGNRTTIPNLSRNRLAELDVPVPKLDEQLAIVRVLSIVRGALHRQERISIVTEQLKRSAMRELFTRGLRGEDREDTDIGLLPKSWEVSAVESIASAISKGSSPKWQGFDYVSNGVLFVRSQNVGAGCMLLDDRVFLAPSWNEKEKRSILHSGDVLLNLVGASIGRCAVGGAEIEGANCNQAVCFIRLNEDLILPHFLCGFLQSEEGQSQIHGSKKDIARANLSLEDVRHIAVPVPALNAQREIVEILDAIDRKIDLHKRKRIVLEKLFNALLHKLMTGEIRVADLDLSALDTHVTAGAAA